MIAFAPFIVNLHGGPLDGCAVKVDYYLFKAGLHDDYCWVLNLMVESLDGGDGANCMYRGRQPFDTESLRMLFTNELDADFITRLEFENGQKK